MLGCLREKDHLRLDRRSRRPGGGRVLPDDGDGIHAGPPGAPRRPAPLDARLTVPGDAFERRGDAGWLAPETAAPFPFKELIYSWQVRLPRDQYSSGASFSRSTMS